MAAGRSNQRYVNRSRNTYAQSGDRFYVYGSAAPQTAPLPQEEPRRRREAPQAPKKVSRQVARNRNRARRIDKVYASFFVAAAVCAVFLCVVYLKTQTAMISRTEEITALQEELSELTESNDAAYNAAVNSVDLDELRERAEKLGLVYASEGTVIEYTSPTSDYVTQYEEIPEDGILAGSTD